MLSGGLVLQVGLSGGVVRSAVLCSSRKVTLCQAMLGRPPAEVPAAFGHLYALCGRSHRIAAQVALDAALGVEASEAARHAAVRELAEGIALHAPL